MHWRKHVLFYSIIAMVVSLFVSRALLSVSMMLFVVASLCHRDIRTHIRSFFSSPLLWGMSLLLVMPLISGAWSEDKEEWLHIVRIKLPLFVLPLAFAGPFNFSRKQWDSIAYIFTGMVVAGSAWSMFQYAGNMDAINESYLKAKSIATPLSNDHVRFSWLVSIAALLSSLLAWRNRSANKLLFFALLLVTLWFVIYLHLLAARTGLFSFYIMVFVTGAWLIIKRTNLSLGIGLLLLLTSLPFIAYFSLPSFRNRISYILYDYDYFSDLRYLPGGNDATRIISIRAGWNLLNEHPLLGVGAGDITNETRKWDQLNYPGILETDMHYPSSEWLIYGLVLGWPGLVIFTAVMLIPFFILKKPVLVWILLHLTAALSFLFDMGLEVQFGVFIYSFIVLWWWKWFEPATRNR
jgi:O-antigen ligase